MHLGMVVVVMLILQGSFFVIVSNNVKSNAFRFDKAMIQLTTEEELLIQKVNPTLSGQCF
jgi:hypothetical protein